MEDQKSNKSQYTKTIESSSPVLKDEKEKEEGVVNKEASITSGDEVLRNTAPSPVLKEEKVKEEEVKNIAPTEEGIRKRNVVMTAEADQ